MDLVIHTGLNKTGSSFLQSLLYHNRSRLCSNGIYYPRSPWDEEMAVGAISPGNGHELAQYLLHENVLGLKRLLTNYFNEAETFNCNKVFLTNETLIRIFSNRSCADILNKSVLTSEFSSLKCWVVFRPFHDHALSLYKHRAKGGLWSDYDSWFKSDYETLNLLKELLVHVNEYNWVWRATEYTRDFNELNSFLSDYLDVPELKLRLPELVKINESLSLNELKLIQFAEKIKPGIAPLIHKEFILNIENRRDSNDLVMEFTDVASRHISAHDDTLKKLSLCFSLDYASMIRIKPLSNQDSVAYINQKHYLVLQSIFSLKFLNVRLFVAGTVEKIRKIIYSKRHSLSTKYGGSVRYWNYDKKHAWGEKN